MFMWVQDFYFKEAVVNEIYRMRKNCVVVFIKDDCTNDYSKKFINELSHRIKIRDERGQYTRQIFIMKNEYSIDVPEMYNVDRNSVITAIEFNGGRETGRIRIDDEKDEFIESVIKFIAL